MKLTYDDLQLARIEIACQAITYPTLVQAYIKVNEKISKEVMHQVENGLSINTEISLQIKDHINDFNNFLLNRSLGRPVISS